MAFLRGKHIRIDAEMKNAHKLGPKTFLIELEDQQEKIEGKIKRYQGWKNLHESWYNCRWERKPGNDMKSSTRGGDNGNDVKIGLKKKQF